MSMKMIHIQIHTQPKTECLNFIEHMSLVLDWDTFSVLIVQVGLEDNEVIFIYTPAYISGVLDAAATHISNCQSRPMSSNIR